MSPSETEVEDDLRTMIGAIHRRVRALTVAVLLMALLLALCAAAVYGSLINYFDGDAAMFGATSVGAALVGFVLGWFARRKA
jgi:hypothetical protein